jgi:heterodisulfide reductase subunit A-like polyferredoxin
MHIFTKSTRHHHYCPFYCLLVFMKKDIVIQELSEEGKVIREEIIEDIL